MKCRDVTTASFSSVEVPPGSSNFREVALVIAVPVGSSLKGVSPTTKPVLERSLFKATMLGISSGY